MIKQTEKSLQNKVVLVTGASRGIGHGILMTLGLAGAQVIGTSKTAAGVLKINNACRSHGIAGMGLTLNVCELKSVENALKTIKERFGTVNILVNNAAVTSDNLILRMKDEEWDQVIETDLSAIFRLTKLCLRDMLKARWGRVINIGSVVGTIGNPGQANYCAAKAGLLGFSKAVALEVGSRNITVNTVSPGYIETDMTNVLTTEQRKTIFNRIPMNKIGRIEDIAAAVLFLASENAGYITGQTLHVNGGMYMP